MDPLTSLGLSSDSITCYRMGEVVRSHSSEVPELLPCGYLVGDSNVIKINLKGIPPPTHRHPRPRQGGQREIFISGSENQVGRKLIFSHPPPPLPFSASLCAQV